MSGRTWKIKSVEDQGDCYLVTIALTEGSSWVETWTYEAMGRYVNDLAKRGLLTVDKLHAMEGYM